jgi:hypothetical protein
MRTLDEISQTDNFNGIQMKARHLCVSFAILSITWLQLSAGDSEGAWTFVPANINYPVLKGYNQEGRIGVRKPLKGQDLHVDIGNTISLAGRTINPGGHLSLGLTFFGYGFATTIEDKRLKIGALDGFFGVFALYSSHINTSRWFLRLRVLHHSAHLVDGKFNTESGSWIDDKLPRAITRDQLELTSFHTLGQTRFAVGFVGAWLTRPEEFSSWMVLLNAEHKLYNHPSQKYTLFAANNVRMEHIHSTVLSNTFQAGIKFGEWNGKGLQLYFEYFSGYNFFAEYFDQKLDYTSFGFTVDF